MCELVELYILSLLQKKVNKKDNGLYRDEGQQEGQQTFLEKKGYYIHLQNTWL